MRSPLIVFFGVLFWSVCPAIHHATVAAIKCFVGVTDGERYCGPKTTSSLYVSTAELSHVCSGTCTHSLKYDWSRCCWRPVLCISVGSKCAWPKTTRKQTSTCTQFARTSNAISIITNSNLRFIGAAAQYFHDRTSDCIAARPARWIIEAIAPRFASSILLRVCLIFSWRWVGFWRVFPFSLTIAMWNGHFWANCAPKFVFFFFTRRGKTLQPHAIEMCVCSLLQHQKFLSLSFAVIVKKGIKEHQANANDWRDQRYYVAGRWGEKGIRRMMARLCKQPWMLKPMSILMNIWTPIAPCHMW